MRTITVKSGRLGRYDDVSPFLVESGDLELQFDLPNQSGEFILLSELNGSVCKNPIPKTRKITLKDLRAGELRLEVHHYLRGEMIQAFKIEPLILKSAGDSLSATPEFGAMGGVIERLAEAVQKLEERIEEAENRDKKRDVAYVSYVYAEYRKNGGTLTVKEFFESLGFSFSQQELSELIDPVTQLPFNQK